VSKRHPRRLDPLAADRWDDTVRLALSPLIPADRANPREAGNLLGTLVHHPDLTRAYLTFGVHMLYGTTLSPRIREVAIMRTAHRCDSDYLWSHHLPIAQREGLSDEEIEDIARGVPTADADLAVVRAVDELADCHTVSAATWTSLAQHFSDQQCMDLVFTIGGYTMLALAVNTFGIDDEQR
jgi:4-carboxymuconolactone decarboxylase